MGFSDLRVINDDRVRGGEGFPSHSHRDMEILSYVLEGALAHKDSTGSGGVIRYGDVQRMSAGHGVTHSEMNGSRDEPVHFLQIWLVPERAGLPASYEEKHFSRADKQGRFRLIASPDAAEGSLTIHQDARVFAAVVDEGRRDRALVRARPQRLVARRAGSRHGERARARNRRRRRAHRRGEREPWPPPSRAKSSCSI